MTWAAARRGASSRSMREWSFSPRALRSALGVAGLGLVAVAAGICSMSGGERLEYRDHTQTSLEVLPWNAEIVPALSSSQQSCQRQMVWIPPGSSSAPLLRGKRRSAHTSRVAIGGMGVGCLGIILGE